MNYIQTIFNNPQHKWDKLYHSWQTKLWILQLVDFLKIILFLWLTLFFAFHYFEWIACIIAPIPGLLLYRFLCRFCVPGSSLYIQNKEVKLKHFLL